MSPYGIIRQVCAIWQQPNIWAYVDSDLCHHTASLGKFVAIWQQAINWAHVDSDLCHHMASLGKFVAIWQQAIIWAYVDSDLCHHKASLSKFVPSGNNQIFEYMLIQIYVTIRQVCCHLRQVCCHLATINYLMFDKSSLHKLHFDDINDDWMIYMYHSSV